MHVVCNPHVKHTTGTDKAADFTLYYLETLVQQVTTLKGLKSVKTTHSARDKWLWESMWSKWDSRNAELITFFRFIRLHFLAFFTTWTSWSSLCLWTAFLSNFIRVRPSFCDYYWNQNDWTMINLLFRLENTFSPKVVVSAMASNIRLRLWAVTRISIGSGSITGDDWVPRNGKLSKGAPIALSSNSIRIFVK